MSAQLRELLLVGAGGIGREAAEAVRAANAVTPAWGPVAFLDDDPAKQGTEIAGIPVIGPVEAALDHEQAKVLLCVGRVHDFSISATLAARLALDDERYATVVHPTASVGASCEIGAGSLLLAHADLTADVVIGRHVVVMPQSVLTHDVRIADHATLASGVRLGGGCRVGRGAYIGSGACLRERTAVGEWAVVGMGSVVTRDVPRGRVWYGVPARDVARARCRPPGPSVRATERSALGRSEPALVPAPAPGAVGVAA